MKIRLFSSVIIASGLACGVTPALADPEAVRATIVFWGVDRNGDGAVDRQEADALRAVIFDGMDANHDGRLTKEEAGAALVALKANAKDKAAEKVAKKREDILVKLDLDKPEGIAKDEYLGRGADIFVKADADKDGKLTPKEFVVISESYSTLMPK